MDQGWLYHYNNCFHFFFLKNKGEKKDVVFVLREVATSSDDAIEELTLTRIIWQDTNHVQPPIVRDQELGSNVLGWHLRARPFISKPIAGYFLRDAELPSPIFVGFPRIQDW